MTNRRNLLKSLGAAAGASAFGVGTASATKGDDAEEREVTQRQVDRIRNDPKVRSLQNEIEIEFEITPSNTRYRVLETEEVTFHAFNVRTAVGTLTFGEIEGSETAAGLRLKQSVRADGRNKLPEKYRNLPATESMLIGMENGVEFRRETTEQEHRRLAAAADVSLNRSSSVVGTDMDGVHISVDQSRETQSVESSESSGLIVTIDELEYSDVLSTIDAATVQTDQLSTQQVGTEWESCLSECSQCIATVGSVCGSCKIPCSGSPTGWGLILCAACIKGACEIGSIPICYDCFDCIGEYT